MKSLQGHRRIPRPCKRQLDGIGDREAIPDNVPVFVPHLEKPDWRRRRGADMSMIELVLANPALEHVTDNDPLPAGCHDASWPHATTDSRNVAILRCSSRLPLPLWCDMTRRCLDEMQRWQCIRVPGKSVVADELKSLHDIDVLCGIPIDVLRSHNPQLDGIGDREAIPDNVPVFVPPKSTLAETARSLQHVNMSVIELVLANPALEHVMDNDPLPAGCHVMLPGHTTTTDSRSRMSPSAALLEPSPAASVVRHDSTVSGRDAEVADVHPPVPVRRKSVVADELKSLHDIDVLCGIPIDVLRSHNPQLDGIGDREAIPDNVPVFVPPKSTLAETARSCNMSVIELALANPALEHVMDNDPLPAGCHVMLPGHTTTTDSRSRMSPSAALLEPSPAASVVRHDSTVSGRDAEVADVHPPVPVRRKSVVADELKSLHDIDVLCGIPIDVLRSHNPQLDGIGDREAIPDNVPVFVPPKSTLAETARSCNMSVIELVLANPALEHVMDNDPLPAGCHVMLPGHTTTTDSRSRMSPSAALLEPSPAASVVRHDSTVSGRDAEVADVHPPVPVRRKSVVADELKSLHDIDVLCGIPIDVLRSHNPQLDGIGDREAIPDNVPVFVPPKSTLAETARSCNMSVIELVLANPCIEFFADDDILPIGVRMCFPGRCVVSEELPRRSLCVAPVVARSKAKSFTIGLLKSLDEVAQRCSIDMDALRSENPHLQRFAENDPLPVDEVCLFLPACGTLAETAACYGLSCFALLASNSHLNVLLDDPIPCTRVVCPGYRLCGSDLPPCSLQNSERSGAAELVDVKDRCASLREFSVRGLAVSELRVCLTSLMRAIASLGPRLGYHSLVCRSRRKVAPAPIGPREILAIELEESVVATMRQGLSELRGMITAFKIQQEQHELCAQPQTSQLLHRAVCTAQRLFLMEEIRLLQIKEEMVREIVHVQERGERAFVHKRGVEDAEEWLHGAMLAYPEQVPQSRCSMECGEVAVIPPSAPPHWGVNGFVTSSPARMRRLLNAHPVKGGAGSAARLASLLHRFDAHCSVPPQGTVVDSVPTALLTM